MKRRKFIHSAAAGVVVPAVLNGMPLRAYSNNAWLESFLDPDVDTDRVMVVIFLNGGNDGINTVVPIDQYARLTAARPHVILNENRLLRLNGQDKIRLHPALTGFQSLFNEGKLSIIQGVGYPNPNFSHFRATDIWTSGSDADQYLISGWLGRYLDKEFPGFPGNYPNDKHPHPLALQIVANLPLLFQGPIAQFSMNLSNPDIFGDWPSGINDPVPSSPLGKELSYIRTINRQSKTYADHLVRAFLQGNNVATYPSGNYLADTLKVVARVIKGGLKTRLFLVSIAGFDTHAQQVEADKHTGFHATLLGWLSSACLAFQRDLEAMKLDDRVIGMMFSEFGRRIISNDSMGTDHGAAGPMFVFGKNVIGGVIGANPNIPANATVNDNVPMQYDFRSVYASLLKDWFCMSQNNVKDVLLKEFPTLPIIKNNCATNTLDEFLKKEEALGLEVYPNPLVTNASIKIDIPEGKTIIQLFDPTARVIRTLFEGRLPAGNHQFSLENENFPSGNYYVRLQHEVAQKTVPVMITD